MPLVGVKGIVGACRLERLVPDGLKFGIEDGEDFHDIFYGLINYFVWFNGLPDCWMRSITNIKPTKIVMVGMTFRRKLSLSKRINRYRGKVTMNDCRKSWCMWRWSLFPLKSLLII